MLVYSPFDRLMRLLARENFAEFLFAKFYDYISEIAWCECGKRMNDLEFLCRPLAQFQIRNLWFKKAF